MPVTHRYKYKRLITMQQWLISRRCRLTVDVQQSGLGVQHAHGPALVQVSHGPASVNGRCVSVHASGVGYAKCTRAVKCGAVVDVVRWRLGHAFRRWVTAALAVPGKCGRRQVHVFRGAALSVAAATG